MAQTYDHYSAERRARLSSAGEVAVRVFFNLLPHPTSRYAPSAIVERRGLTGALPDAGPAARRRQQLRMAEAVSSSDRAAAFREALLEAAAASRIEPTELHEDHDTVGRGGAGMSKASGRCGGLAPCEAREAQPD